MARFKSHRYNEYGETDEGLHLYYQSNDWSRFAQYERDQATVRVGLTFPKDEIASVGDMSAGGSDMALQISGRYGCVPVLGDLGEQYGYAHTGTLQQTLIRQGVFDLYICAETIEHLRDPDTDLALIRQHCKYLLLTTPTMEKPESCSHGHLWTWEREDVENMLEIAGFTPISFEQISIFGIWKCR